VLNRSVKERLRPLPPRKKPHLFAKRINSHRRFCLGAWGSPVKKNRARPPPNPTTEGKGGKKGQRHVTPPESGKNWARKESGRVWHTMQGRGEKIVQGCAPCIRQIRVLETRTSQRQLGKKEKLRIIGQVGDRLPKSNDNRRTGRGSVCNTAIAAAKGGDPWRNRRATRPTEPEGRTAEKRSLCPHPVRQPGPM